jgi:hypothetical protein
VLTLHRNSKQRELSVYLVDCSRLEDPKQLDCEGRKAQVTRWYPNQNSWDDGTVQVSCLRSGSSSYGGKRDRATHTHFREK